MKSPSNNGHVVGHGFGVAIDDKATDNPKKHIEDSSTDAEEGNKENIGDAKPPADTTPDLDITIGSKTPFTAEF